MFGQTGAPQKGEGFHQELAGLGKGREGNKEGVEEQESRKEAWKGGNFPVFSRIPTYEILAETWTAL